MTIQVLNFSFARFVFVAFAISACGCAPTTAIDPPVAQPTSRPDPIGGPFAGEKTIILSGEKGGIVLSKGRVLTADGAACPNALVTLDQDIEGSTRRCLFARSDSEGNFVIRGDSPNRFSNMIWAVTESGRLGVSWNAKEPVTIHLRGGSTVLYVQTMDSTPVVNATVTFYQNSIDDISEIVPPNIRKFVTRKTDQHGRVEFASAFGDGDIGFHVGVSGQPGIMRAGYSCYDANLFVIARDQQAVGDRSEALASRGVIDAADDRTLNRGYAIDPPAYLNP